MTSLTLSPSLTSIDGGAFAECSNLSTLIIPSGLTSLSTLNEGSIFVDSGIKSVYVAWPTPVPAGQFFYGFDVSQSTLYVPQGTRQDYWVAAVWEDFGDIQEYEVSAVNQPAHHSEAKEVSRYSLDGQRLTTPVKGLNIVGIATAPSRKKLSAKSFLPAGPLGKGAQAARSCWVGLLRTSLLTLPANRPLPASLSSNSMACATTGRL